MRSVEGCIWGIQTTSHMTAILTMEVKNGITLLLELPPFFLKYTAK
jgi:hypothetical protein